MPGPRDDTGPSLRRRPGERRPVRRRNLLRHRVILSSRRQPAPGCAPPWPGPPTCWLADDAELERAARMVPVRRDPDAVRVPAAALSTLPGPVAGRAARRALRLLLDPYPGWAKTCGRCCGGLRGGALPGHPGRLSRLPGGAVGGALPGGGAPCPRRRAAPRARRGLSAPGLLAAEGRSPGRGRSPSAAAAPWPTRRWPPRPHGPGAGRGPGGTGGAPRPGRGAAGGGVPARRRRDWPVCARVAQSSGCGGSPRRRGGAPGARWSCSG